MYGYELMKFVLRVRCYLGLTFIVLFSYACAGRRLSNSDFKRRARDRFGFRTNVQHCCVRYDTCFRLVVDLNEKKYFK